MRRILLVLTVGICSSLNAQDLPAALDTRMYEIVEAASADRLRQDVTRLVDFGTRHTLSDTLSDERGIGAARRWIKAEFESISGDCGNCLEVFYIKGLVEKGTNARIVHDVEVVNVVAVQRGTRYPDSYIIMSGDIDSRVTDPANFTADSPGANDNATGMAGALEAARILSKYQFPSSIAYVGLSGEEQGLFGGKIMAEQVSKEGWQITGVINNDMIGNIRGVDGVIDNRDFRIFSEPTPVTETDEARRRRRYTGGEVDGISRQLARYVHRMTTQYMPDMNPMLVYRLDRYGRGGHHRPFNDAGYAGIRIMEAHENYVMQHQDIRVEDGIAYGDVIEGVDFDYNARLTAVNAITLAGIAWAPPAPDSVLIGGAVQPSTKLSWTAVEDPDLAGYKIYWRETTEAQWQYSRFVGGQTNEITLEGIVIDNFLFGVASIGKDGNESVVVFPNGRIPRN